MSLTLRCRAEQGFLQESVEPLAARHLQECLLLQSEEDDYDLQQFIQKGSFLLAERKFPELMKSLKLSKERLLALINQLQH
ncbi:hypothetical protein [Lysinibacillus sp. G4S2]|uniref:RNA polymerase factor sigma-54 n=1 Tax=Lysinibacillus sp. G4S2 TaxID=3055859 RepID=UPI0033904010